MQDSLLIWLDMRRLELCLLAMHPRLVQCPELSQVGPGKLRLRNQRAAGQWKVVCNFMSVESKPAERVKRGDSEPPPDHPQRQVKPHTASISTVRSSLGPTATAAATTTATGTATGTATPTLPLSQLLLLLLPLTLRQLLLLFDCYCCCCCNCWHHTLLAVQLPGWAERMLGPPA